MGNKHGEHIGGFFGRIFSKSGASMRSKLIVTFLLTKIIPILVLTVIAMIQILSLGDSLQDMAVQDATVALNNSAVENIERMSTDTAHRIADFLYQRDNDIRSLAKVVGKYRGETTQTAGVCEDFVNHAVGRLVKPGEWVLSADSARWVPKQTTDMSASLGSSTNVENNDMHNGSSFHTRPADALVYECAPLYDEVTFVDLNGNEIVKIGTVSHESSRKNRYKAWFLTGDTRNISEQKNTFIGAESYWPALQPLTGEAGNDIYVSDVIGAYVGSNYIGMYTPKTVQDAADARGYDIPYRPMDQAYAGEENPNGMRFEGIVRWASPVYSDGEKIGYVTLALNHDHIMEFVDHQTPMAERYTELPNAHEGNYAFIWDYQCRSIAHPRHHSIVGFDPQTGAPQVPWLSQANYLRLLEKSGLSPDDIAAMEPDARLSALKANWKNLIALPDDGRPVYEMIQGEPTFHDQARSSTDTPTPLLDDPEHTVAADLTRLSHVGLDGRYLNNAPQCTGWLDITGNGGSGSLYILWSGIYKLNTAAAIPYYTGQYAPSAANPYPRVGFGFVAIGAGLEDFTAPAAAMEENLDSMVADMTSSTVLQTLLITIALMIFIVIVAVNLSAFITENLDALSFGVTRFKTGERQFRFNTHSRDEFGVLASAFDDMADSIDNNNSGSLVITDLDLRIRYVNKPGLVLLDKTLDEVVGAPYRDHSIYPANTIHCPIWALENEVEAAAYYLPASGQYFIGTANYFVDNKHNKAGFIIESTDVTEIQLAKNRAEEATLAKSQFLSSMSHEIRTPMNSIMGFAELAQDYTIAPQVRDYLSKITDNTKLLLHIINDILDISKIESGKMELENIPFDLPSIFSRCQSVILPQVNQKHLTLHVYAEPIPGRQIIGDPVRLYQVLMNLLSNAVKFTAEGTVRLSSAVMRTDAHRATLYFEVRDEGIGMTDEQLSRVFEPFMQADSSTTRNFGGTGLGLSITKSFVELMGGTLNVESTIGLGSTFSFEIAFETVEAPGELPEHTEIAAGVRPHFNGLILICEDNPMNQQLISDHLTRVGLHPVIAENGKLGVEMVHERQQKGLKPFDLIFMDIFMPVMDGVDAAAQINALETGTPIVALTANVMTSDLERYRQSGMADHVGKPFTTQELWRCLHKYLKPLSVSTENEVSSTNYDEVLLVKLKMNFVQNNRTKFSELTTAIAESDFTLAHRLAHTLKGNAGLIGKGKLQAIAADIETLLKDEKMPSTEQVALLESELNSVLNELMPLLEAHAESPALLTASREQAVAIFDKLAPMLKSRSPECLTLLNALRTIPGTEMLSSKIEKYDFKLAAQILADLRKEWE